MNIDLRYTGLMRDVEQRVRLAARSLAAHHIAANAAAWNGDECDVVVVDSSDVLGVRALALARQRGIPVLDVQAGTDGSNRYIANIAWLTKSLLDLMRPQPGDGGTGDGALISGSDAAGLVRLATETRFMNTSIEASYFGTRVWLLPRAGRIVSATVSERLRARDRLGSSGWTFTPIPNDPSWRPAGEVSASLDAFFLQAAWRIREQLPRYPQGRYRLREWPDLGSASDLVEALRVVLSLLKETRSIAETARASNTSEADVSACLWALKASGILTGEAVGPSRAPEVGSRFPTQRAATGLWSRLAAHFGLARAS